jgi:hypothetical protein
MVKKYYFQSLNGSLTFVHYGTKEELSAKVDKELGGDKAQALKQIDESVEAAKAKLAELEEKLKTLTDDKPEYYETQSLICNYKGGLIKAKAERERVEKEGKPDLVFFELTPIEL